MSCGRPAPFNYVRNSVKGVVDTYDGTVTLYVVDPTDPVIAAYQQAFPELFTDASEMSQDLVSHLRYPEDLFRVQTDMWGRYHIADSKSFYDRTDAWEPPPSPPDSPPTGGAQTAQPAITVPAGPGGSTTGVTTKSARMAPSYVINQLPDEDETSFKIMRAYQPYSDDDSKQLLTAFMVGGQRRQPARQAHDLRADARRGVGARADRRSRHRQRDDPERRRGLAARSRCSTRRART